MAVLEPTFRMVEGGVHEPAPGEEQDGPEGPPQPERGGRAGLHTAVTPSALWLDVPYPPSAFSTQPLKPSDGTSLPDPL